MSNNPMNSADAPTVQTIIRTGGDAQRRWQEKLAKDWAPDLTNEKLDSIKDALDMLLSVAERGIQLGSLRFTSIPDLIVRDADLLGQLVGSTAPGSVLPIIESLRDDTARYMKLTERMTASANSADSSPQEEGAHPAETCLRLIISRSEEDRQSGLVAYQEVVNGLLSLQLISQAVNVNKWLDTYIEPKDLSELRKWTWQPSKSSQAALAKLVSDLQTTTDQRTKDDPNGMRRLRRQHLARQAAYWERNTPLKNVTARAKDVAGDEAITLQVEPSKLFYADFSLKHLLAMAAAVPPYTGSIASDEVNAIKDSLTEILKSADITRKEVVGLARAHLTSTAGSGSSSSSVTKASPSDIKAMSVKALFADDNLEGLADEFTKTSQAGLAAANVVMRNLVRARADLDGCQPHAQHKGSEITYNALSAMVDADIAELKMLTEHHKAHDMWVTPKKAKENWKKLKVTCQASVDSTSSLAKSARDAWARQGVLSGTDFENVKTIGDYITTEREWREEHVFQPLRTSDATKQDTVDSYISPQTAVTPHSSSMASSSKMAMRPNKQPRSQQATRKVQRFAESAAGKLQIKLETERQNAKDEPSDAEAVLDAQPTGWSVDWYRNPGLLSWFDIEEMDDDEYGEYLKGRSRA